ncbi:MAG TPA: hypothetical protein VN673_15875, partial [Clostridia bacterium]|nr:hypothetical protein [Clostridia bacterium]
MRTHLLCLLAGLGSLGVCLGQSPAFTYQGVLRDGTNAPAGVYDFVFRLYDAAENGAPVSAAITNLAVGTSEGRFTVRLNFGSEAFTGSPRWLAIAVRTNGSSPFVTLTPRQELTATPHALYAANLARTFAGPVAFTNQANTYFGEGSGLTGVNASLLAGLGPGSFWKVGGNTALPAEANFIGTLDTQPFEIRVNGAPAFRLTPGPGPNLVAGGTGNALDKASASVIGGGDDNKIDESAYSVIGGGFGNSITNETLFGTIAGGAHNAISRFDFLMPGGAANSF